MQKAVSVVAWLCVAASFLTITIAFHRRPSTPRPGYPPETRTAPLVELDSGHESISSLPIVVDPDSHAEPEPGDAAPASILLSRKAALVRMFECWKAADPLLEFSWIDFQRYEESLRLDECASRSVWKLEEFRAPIIWLDAESGTLLKFIRRVGRSEARVVSKARAEAVTRRFLVTAYTEFPQRPFRLDKLFDHGSLLVCFKEDHGSDATQFQNGITVEIDSGNGEVVSYSAMYIRVQADSIRFTSDMALEMATSFLFPAGHSVRYAETQLHMEVRPISKSRATVYWNISFTYRVPNGESKYNTVEIQVNATTGEIIDSRLTGKKD